MAIRSTSDAGTPVVASAPDGPHAAYYKVIAENMLTQLHAASAEASPPNIVID